MSKELKRGDFPELDWLFEVIAQSDDMVEAIDYNLPDDESFALQLIQIIETLLQEAYSSASLAQYLDNINVAIYTEDPRLNLAWYRDTVASIAKDRFSG